MKGTPYLLAVEYAVLAMPFAYRSLDAGRQALNLQTLVEASRSLGAGWLTTGFRVLLPNLRSSLLAATILTVALVLGEYTMASLDQYETFAVWVVVYDQSNAPCRWRCRCRHWSAPPPRPGPTSRPRARPVGPWSV